MENTTQPEIQRIYENDDFVVCIKPSGILSQKDSSNKTNMETLLGGEIYCLHRLDREVSGIMVYAKNKRTAANLTTQIQNHTFQKEYYAVIHGTMDAPSATLEDLLFKDSRKNKTFVVKRERKGVKPAKLSYQTLATTQDLSLVQVQLYTGRTHQIRVQFSSRKHPIVGDRKYGSTTNGQMALFSHSIAFSYRGETMKFTYEELPQILQNQFEIQLIEGEKNI